MFPYSLALESQFFVELLWLETMKRSNGRSITQVADRCPGSLSLFQRRHSLQSMLEKTFLPPPIFEHRNVQLFEFHWKLRVLGSHMAWVGWLCKFDVIFGTGLVDLVGMVVSILQGTNETIACLIESEKEQMELTHAHVPRAEHHPSTSNAISQTEGLISRTIMPILWFPNTSKLKRAGSKVSLVSKTLRLKVLNCLSRHVNRLGATCHDPASNWLR